MSVAFSRADAALLCFDDEQVMALRAAQAMGLPLSVLERHRFPDGELRLRLPDPLPPRVVIWRGLQQPNEKLVELLLAARTARTLGARHLTLVTPYLAYMRQDMAFHPGEAVSQRVIGGLLAQWFDGVVTVDPHLHRIERLNQAIPGIPALALSAAPALVAALAEELDPATVLVGPDSESRPWVESIAAPLGLHVLVGEKVRHGDRAVTLELPGISAVRDRPALLVDDVISSGTTLIACADLLRAAGASGIEAVATHALASPADMARMAAAGISCIRATDATIHPAATIPLARVLADAIRAAGWLETP